MSISYPLNIPDGRGFSGFKLVPKTFVGASPSPFTGGEQVQEHDGNLWFADVVLPRLSQADAADWEGFILSLHGKLGTFLMGDPMRQIPNGEAASSPGTPLVNGSVLMRSKELPVYGAPVNKTAWLRRGDHIQLGSGSSTRLHSVLADADTDGSGETVLDIWPPTRTAMIGDEDVIVNNPKGIWRLSSNENPFNRNHPLFTTINFSVKEAL